jgi:DNA helicase-2/ATP-dependent DNA helicase PcrA
MPFNWESALNKYGLNDEQWAAVGNNNIFSYVNASAGSGKTRCLTKKIHYLLDSGADPSSIAAMTFTNKAAKEMKDRLKKYGDVEKLQVSTIHSVCVRIIRKYIGHTYLKSPFSIYDGSDQLSVVKTIVKAKELPGDPYDYLSYISRVKSGNIIQAVQDDYKFVLNEYQEILKQNNAVDFDDLLILAYDCLQHEDCKKFYSNLWRHILVDEFQDTNKVQYNVIMSLYDPAVTKTLFFVGDANQSVYGWRGARPENINDFIRDYKANVKYLTYNYRSCSEIIAHANGFQQFGQPMVPKTPITGKISVTAFPSQEEEAEQIAQALLKMGNYNNTAIIYRVNTRSLFFEQTFARYRIPYKVVNDLSFFQRKVSKDLLAALSAANNPDDRTSLARIINTPKRGFGDIKKARLLKEGRPYLESVLDDNPLVKGFMDLLDEVRGKNPSEALALYLHRSKYRENLKDSDRYMVEALENMVVNFDTVEDLILASSFIQKDSKEGISLITAHGSKGLEFDRVFLVGVEEGLWPHKNAEDIDEEFRLYFVACSRSKIYLNISYSKKRNFKGSPIEIRPSHLFIKSYKHVMGRDYPH